MSVLDNINEKIREKNSILIVTHTNPDGDAVGSSLGLRAALQKIDKKVDVYMPELNKNFSFLPGYNDILTNIEDTSVYDLCIALDSSDIERLGKAGEVFTKIEDTIVIDHHITNQGFGDITYLNAVASSTCENIIVVLAAMDIAINKEIAEPLYTGILTDTGAFRYNTQPETYEFVAMLIETGIDAPRIYRTLFDLTTFSRQKLLSRVLERMERLEDGKVYYSYVTLKDLEEFGIDENDTDDLVNYGRNNDGAEVSILIKEKVGCYKVSLRANDYVDVSLVASKFAGGGHVRAAGFESTLDMEGTKKAIIEEIRKQL